MHRSTRVALLAALTLVCALALAPSASARGCQKRNTRWGYVNELKAFSTSCRSARAVSGSFNTCRHRTFRAGACHRVSGWDCRETRRSVGRGLIIARVACRRGGRRVSFLNLSRG